jgi:hypothetical protein
VNLRPTNPDTSEIIFPPNPVAGDGATHGYVPSLMFNR